MLDPVLLLCIMLVSLGITVICIRRLMLTHRGVYLRVRNRYVVLGTGSLLSAFGHFIFPWPGEMYGMAAFVGSVAISVLLEHKDWEHGLPESATIPGELYAQQPESSGVH